MSWGGKKKKEGKKKKREKKKEEERTSTQGVITSAFACGVREVPAALVVV